MPTGGPRTAEAYSLMHQGTIALAQVEHAGVKIDTDYLTKTHAKISGDIEDLTKKLQADEVYRNFWRKRFGNVAKLGNPQQLADVVFKDLGYQSKGFNTRGLKADEGAFDEVDHPFVRDCIRLRKLLKVRSPYLTGLMREVVDGFVHPSYHLNLLITYRSGCQNPNFQNIPVRYELMKKIIRRAFVSRFGDKGHVVEFDFKGVEVVTAECYHHDPTMMTYIMDKKNDMHRDTASDLFKMSAAQVKEFDGVRHIAKNKFVFPQFYGDFYASCARAIWDELRKTKCKSSVDGRSVFDHLKAVGITARGDCDPEKPPIRGTLEYRVKEVEDLFWHTRFPVYTAWKRQWYQQYLDTGEVVYHTGFVARGVMKRNEVINYAVQGSAFHCDLWCLIELQKWLLKNKMRSKIIGQIHDSMVCDVHEDELDDFVDKARELMTVSLLKAWPWLVAPLEAEVDVAPPGTSWLDKGKWVRGTNGLWGPKT
jgi:DNA polymerase-1